MNLLTRLKFRLGFFAEDARGSLSVETALIMPLLTWWYVGSFVYFDAFRSQNVNIKAAYTIADMISRERGGVDQDYLDGLNKVFDYLTISNKPTWIRVSSIYWSASENKFKVSWSHTTKSKPVHTDITLNLKAGQIPVMPVGDSVILVETQMAYEPFFNVGLGARWFENFITTRPRFAPCISWEDDGC